MNEQLENSENDFLWKLLANPADPSHSYVYNLQLVVNDYPQSGILRALLVPKGDHQHLKHAAAYFTPATLHKMATNLGGIPKVSDDQIIYVDENTYTPPTYVNPMAEPFVPPIVDDAETNYFHVEDAELQAAVETEEEVETTDNYIEQEESLTTIPEQEYIAAEEKQPEHFALQQDPEPVDDEVYDEIAPHDETPLSLDQPAEEAIPAIEEFSSYNEQQQTETAGEEQPADENLLAKEYEEHLAKLSEANANLPFYTFDSEEEAENDHQDINDEVYEEIVSIEDIGLEQLAIINKSTEEESENTDTEEVAAAEEDQSNYFVFEPEIPEDNNEEASPVQGHQSVITTTALTASTPTTRIDTTQRLSRYNDEKMPYSFMWWLDKTRKEHADKYQPYSATGTKPPAARQETSQTQNVKPVMADELQQQYFENIFNANSINGLDPQPAKQDVEHPARKEDKIIERFIQEEPQIKHPSTVKLNSENKAKKSSEDRDELVTETLAKIYTEQMLYHKAINTYKKLMLKFPEKSLYFAGQIEQLENKIN